MAHNKNIDNSKLAQTLESSGLISVDYTPKGQFSCIHYQDLDFKCNNHMSSSDILELLQAIQRGQNEVISSMSMSASESKQLQRANERGKRALQNSTYVKTEVNKKDNDTQELVKTKDLVKILNHFDYDLDFIRNSLINKYSDDIDFLSKTYSTFDLSNALRMGGVVKVDASHIITLNTLEKINSLVERMDDLKREIKGA